MTKPFVQPYSLWSVASIRSYVDINFPCKMKIYISHENNNLPFTMTVTNFHKTSVTGH